ncbi:MAG: 30S ribosomal protein S10 [Candidatus Moranbacteria bacterium]|nr:30S ribosomal protein S10 [Candidatus Moranbacteria bacterium]
MATKKSVATAQDEKPRIRIKIKGYDHRVIDKSTKQIIDTAQRNGASVVGPIPLPTTVKRLSVNRSTFKHKYAKDQYEIKTHKRLLDIEDFNQMVVESLVNLDLPAGVDIEVKM